MTRTERVKNIIQTYRVGLCTEAEANDVLDKLQVRGGFDGVEYTGYDYADQQWITTKDQHNG